MKLIKESESLLINQTNILIYGEAGVGKTSIASTSKNPILLDFDEGAYRSGYRKDILKISDFSEIKDDFKNFINIISEYDTIIIDTIGSLQDMIKSYLIIKDPSLTNKRKSFELWGNMLSETMDFFKIVKSLKKSTISVAHIQEKMRGDDIIKRPVIAGQSKDQLYRLMDFIGYMYFRNGLREITFSPKDDGVEGKNTGGYSDMKVPNVMDDNYFEIEMINMLGAVNNQNKSNEEAIKEIKFYKEKIADFTSAEHFNNLLKSITDVKQKNIIWEMLLDFARKLDLNYDKTKKEFK
jgi:hypothetical protein